MPATQAPFSFTDDVIAALPRLRALARALHHGREDSDDLVQITLTKALANSHRFEPGTNMMGWLYTIMRNEFYSEFRRRRHEVGDVDGQYSKTLKSPPTQDGHVYFSEVQAAYARLSPEHREALMLTVSGMSYEEMANLCGCAIGTIKSRVSRARERLAELLRDRQNRVGTDVERSALF